ncbi:glycosyltransferase [Cyanobacteria bacterium FACHB-63]|nr:glycosyltransferase [Cyanobacteria bacterium FACHB-63]
MSNRLLQSMPLVSVIIDGFNQGCFVADAIESVLSQTYSNIEIIVVDDGSSDHSKEVISRYKGSVYAIFKANGGQSSALNAGFKQSHGEIICFLDADDIFLPNKVDKVVSSFQTSSEIGWCFHPLRYTHKTLDQVIVDYPVPPSEHSCVIDFRSQIIKKAIIPVWGPATSAISLKRSLAEKIFPIPEYLRISSDAYLRYSSLAISKGFFLNQSLSILRMHDENTYNSNTKDDRQKKRYARALLCQANSLRTNFPQLRKATNKLFAWGLVDLDQNLEVEYQEILQSYLVETSLLERIEIYSRYSLHRLKRILQRIGHLEKLD